MKNSAFFLGVFYFLQFSVDVKKSETFEISCACMNIIQIALNSNLQLEGEKLHKEKENPFSKSHCFAYLWIECVCWLFVRNLCFDKSIYFISNPQSVGLSLAYSMQMNAISGNICCE